MTSQQRSLLTFWNAELKTGGGGGGNAVQSMKKSSLLTLIVINNGYRDIIYLCIFVQLPKWISHYLYLQSYFLAFAFSSVHVQPV